MPRGPDRRGIACAHRPEGLGRPTERWPGRRRDPGVRRDRSVRCLRSIGRGMCASIAPPPPPPPPPPPSRARREDVMRSADGALRSAGSASRKDRSGGHGDARDCPHRPRRGPRGRHDGPWRRRAGRGPNCSYTRPSHAATPPGRTAVCNATVVAERAPGSSAGLEPPPGEMARIEGGDRRHLTRDPPSRRSSANGPAIWRRRRPRPSRPPMGAGSRIERGDIGPPDPSRTACHAGYAGMVRRGRRGGARSMR